VRSWQWGTKTRNTHTMDLTIAQAIAHITEDFRTNQHILEELRKGRKNTLVEKDSSLPFLQ